MRNAKGKMRNDQCRKNVIGHFERPRDHTDSANYHAAELAYLVTYLLGYLVDKSSSPDGTTRINLLRKESTVSESITSEDNKFHGSTTR